MPRLVNRVLWGKADAPKFCKGWTVTLRTLGHAVKSCVTRDNAICVLSKWSRKKNRLRKEKRGRFGFRYAQVEASRLVNTGVTE